MDRDGKQQREVSRDKGNIGSERNTVYTTAEL